jgi:molybdate transport system substrate-binding protein
MAAPDGNGRILPALLISSALPFACQAAPKAPPAPVRVAAASDLTLAFEELGNLFERQTGQRVTFSFAASGALAKQLERGAPFDLFAAANPAFADAAVAAGACDGSSKALYARGYLVAWSKNGGARVASLSDLARPEIKRIAIANPEHAPYGKAAREALLEAGVWNAVEAKLVRGENVRQTLQFAQTGNADVALVALSLVAQDHTGQTLAIDPRLHGPIEQTLVVCRRGKNEAGGRAFAELVASPEGQTVLKRHGFGGSAEQAAQ